MDEDRRHSNHEWGSLNLEHRNRNQHIIYCTTFTIYIEKAKNTAARSAVTEKLPLETALPLDDEEGEPLAEVALAGLPGLAPYAGQLAFAAIGQSLAVHMA
jgi:hypothetical protein